MTLPLIVSSIAWPAAELDAALDHATSLGLDGVEIAPFSLFGTWNVSASDLDRLAAELRARGLRCLALQGILFRAESVELFASAESRAALAIQLQRVAAMAGRLGAQACVYGAPRQRDPANLSLEEARAIAMEFFHGVGSYFASEGSALAIEANARHYGCRFLTTTAEAATFVAQVATPGVGLQIDTGTIFLEAEPPSVLHLAAPLAVHAHVSEPDLSPLGTSGAAHEPVAAALRESGYRGAVSIEMRSGPAWRSAVTQAVQLVRSTYLTV